VCGGGGEGREGGGGRDNFLLGTDPFAGLGAGAWVKPGESVVVTASLLCRLASSTSSAARMTSRAFSELYKHRKLGSLRSQALTDLVLLKDTALPPELTREGGDRALAHWTQHVTALVATGAELVHWDDPLLGCLGGHVYGVGSGGILALAGPHKPSGGRQELILGFKSGVKPTGVQALNRWAAQGSRGKYPDSALASDVLQMNLRAHAREAERRLAGELFDPTTLQLVYGNAHGNAMEVYIIPAT
jgi:hypothetical protein